jgi:hypothetical protein
MHRYSNRAHPDYHPAGGYVTSTLGPLYYALAQGGTHLYPGAEGMLRPVTFASLGLGVDHAR